MEDTISLKDIIVKVLRKWRIIIVISILFGIIFGGAKFFLQSAPKPDTVKMDDITKKYVLDTRIYNQQLENHNNTILRATNSIEALNEYMQYSVLMTIDPYNKPVSSTTIFISDEANSKSNLSSVSSAYGNIFADEELFTALSKKYNFVNSKYMRELVYFYTSSYSTLELINEAPSSHSMHITVTHSDAKVSAAILSDVLEYINDNYDLINQDIGSHKLIFMPQNTYTIIDTGLQATQNHQVNQITTFKNQIDSSNNALFALVEPEDPNESNTPMINSIKYGIVGIFVGGMISCIAVLMIVLLSPVVMSEDALVIRYNTKILGNLSSVKRRKD